MRRLTRLRGLVGLGIARTVGQFRHGNRNRLLLSMTGVAVAIGLMVVVTSTSLGLATQTTIYSEDVDYWIVPEQGSVSTMAVSVGGPQFGDVHETSQYLTDLQTVEYASPVSMRVVRMNARGITEPEYVLLVGVISHDGLSVAGLPAGALAPGDPYYANGSYNGPWTGDLVAAPATASILNVSEGDTLQPVGTATNRSFTVSHVARDGVQTGAGELPVALVHLSELQALEQSPPRDTADQFLVHTSSPGVRDTLASVYPESTVVERSGLSTQSVVSSDLSLAIALTAFLVALVLGTLFVATALGLEITADRAQLATLTALGYTGRSTSLLIATQTLTITTFGGILGLALGAGGIAVVNRVAADTLGTGTIAVAHPLLAPYGIAVAVAIGLIATPYLAWLARRTTTTEHLTV